MSESPAAPTSVELRAEGLLLEVVTAGAAVRRLEVPDADGRPVGIVLGHADARTYVTRRRLSRRHHRPLRQPHRGRPLRPRRRDARAHGQRGHHHAARRSRRLRPPTVDRPRARRDEGATRAAQPARRPGLPGRPRRHGDVCRRAGRRAHLLLRDHGSRHRRQPHQPQLLQPRRRGQRADRRPRAHALVERVHADGRAAHPDGRGARRRRQPVRLPPPSSTRGGALASTTSSSTTVWASTTTSSWTAAACVTSRRCAAPRGAPSSSRATNRGCRSTPEPTSTAPSRERQERHTARARESPWRRRVSRMRPTMRTSPRRCSALARSTGRPRCGDSADERQWRP